MAPVNNRFLQADMIVGVTTLCVGAAVWFSLSRDEGYFSKSSASADNDVKTKALAQLESIKKEGGKALNDPTLPANVNKAFQLFQQGSEEVSAGLYKAAIVHFKEACQSDPVRKIYWSALGHSYMHEGQYENARAAFLEVYDRDVYDTFNLNNLGYVCQALRKDKEAKRFYLMALTVKPDLQDTWSEMYNVAHGLRMESFYDEIHQASLTPTNSDNCALVYQLNQAALEENPDGYYYLVNRALMNIRYMRLTNVQNDIDKALKINPNGAAALLAQAQIYSNMGDLDRAAEAYKRCLAVSPQPVAYAELGAIEMQKGHIDRALHDYGKATELGNDKPSWVGTYNRLRNEKFKRDASGPAGSGVK